jgi:hypothetical protein
VGLLLALATLAAALGASKSPAAALGPSKTPAAPRHSGARCHLRGHNLYPNGRAIVVLGRDSFRRGSNGVFGCLRRTGRVHELLVPYADLQGGAQTASVLMIAGDWVIIHETDVDPLNHISGEGDWVADLATGRAYAYRGQDDGSTEVRRYLSPHGQVVRSFEDFLSPDARIFGAPLRAGIGYDYFNRRVKLDDALETSLDPRSLVVHGLTVTWARDGRRHSALLP